MPNERGRRPNKHDHAELADTLLGGDYKLVGRGRGSKQILEVTLWPTTLSHTHNHTIRGSRHRRRRRLFCTPFQL